MIALRKQAKGGAARKSSPSYLKSNFKVGDRVRVIDIADDLKDPDYDLKHDTAERKMRTGELFRFCIGRVFTVYGFGRCGHVELQVDRSPTVRRKGFSGMIWIEPDFLKRVGHRRLKVRSKADRNGTPEGVPRYEALDRKTISKACGFVRCSGFVSGHGFSRAERNKIESGPLGPGSKRGK